MNLEISPHTYNQVIIDEGTKSIHVAKDTLFIKCVDKTEHPHEE
jgi:hypothetical protein